MRSSTGRAASGILGVAVSKQLHRTLDIGEQHGDLLALTLEGCPRGEDLVGKVLGCVAPGRSKPGIVSGLRGWPHWEQNLAVAETSLPQLAHILAGASGAAHSSQNFAPQCSRAGTSGISSRPRRKKRAGCAASVTPRMMDNKALVPFPSGSGNESPRSTSRPIGGAKRRSSRHAKRTEDDRWC